MKRNNSNTKFSQRLLSPYMVGLYLGVNAIKDFYLLVDGPDCSYIKTQYISLNHDFYANLTNLSGFHRIANTALHPIMMAGSREEKIQQFLDKIASQPFTKALGITPMPMAAVTSVDYKRLLREIFKKYKKPVFEFPNKSLSGDWMDGYAEFTKVIASEIELKRKRKDKRLIGIVGYLFDRNEYDNFANISELKRIFSGIGVDICSIWLNGGCYDELKEIANSEIILSFGYGESAAEILSERLQIPLIKLDYPIGLEQTEIMLRKVADFFGLKNVDRFIEDEKRKTIRRIEPLIEQYFYNLSAIYCGDPILFKSLKKSTEVLGVEINLAIITNTLDKKRFIQPYLDNVIFEPTINEIIERSLKLAKDKNIDLYIGNSDMSTYFIGSGKATLEIGFPSYFSHSIYEEPYIGFNGFISILNRIVKELKYAKVRGIYGRY